MPRGAGMLVLIIHDRHMLNVVVNIRKPTMKSTVKSTLCPSILSAIALNV